MKKITYMTAVDYLFIPDKFSLSVGFDDCLTLTNDVELIKRLINKVHSANMGVLEYNHLVSGRPILYSVREYRGL